MKVLHEKRGVNGDTRFRFLGLLPLLFFIAQGVHYWRINELGHMLWMCNIGNLLFGPGIVFQSARNDKGSCDLDNPGTCDVASLNCPAMGVVFASVLAHVRGLLVGLVALRRVGVDRYAWVYGLGWYFVVQLTSRFSTRYDFNVNASARDLSGLGSYFPCLLEILAGDESAGRSYVVDYHAGSQQALALPA